MRLPKGTLKRAMQYASYLTPESARRKPSAIRALQPLVALPGMISLGGGMPNANLFPIKKMSFTLDDGTVMESVPSELNAALQYSPTPGLPELVKRLRTMQIVEHNPPEYEGGISISVVPGSQDGLAKIFDMLVSEQDSLLIEAPTYSGTLAALEAKGCKLVGVPTDELGLNPASLRQVLEGWDVTRDGRKPRVLYTIPTGANPTGASMNLERKREVYALAQEHELLIVEDDPYYYMQYAETRTPSFLSMDVDGRVLRTDSFSKIVSAGVRIGCVTGPKALVERMDLHNQATIMHTSGLSQYAVLQVLRHWGVGDDMPNGAANRVYPAWESHLRKNNAFYLKQCDVFFEAAAKHLRGDDGKPLAEYKRPTAGMFVWMKLLGVTDSTQLIMTEAVEKKVLLVPGSAFFPGAPKTQYVRAAFSVASHAEIDTAMQRLGDMLRTYLRKQKS